MYFLRKRVWVRVTAELRFLPSSVTGVNPGKKKCNWCWYRVQCDCTCMAHVPVTSSVTRCSKAPNSLFFFFVFFFPGLNNNCDIVRKWGEKMPACVRASPGPCKAALHCPCCSWRQMPRPPRWWGWWGWSLWRAGAGGWSPSLCPQCQGDVRAPPLHPLGASPPAQLGRDVPNMGRFPRDRDVFGKRCGSPRIAGLLAFPSQPCLLCVTSSYIRALLYFCTTPRPVRSAARLSYKQIPGKAVSP